MYHFFVSPDQIEESLIRIQGKDVNHIKNVLRMRCGEEILISNGIDRDYHCRITEISQDQVVSEILGVDQEGTELPARLFLFQGLPKSDKMELIIQKAVELGVYQIIPVVTKRTIVKLDAKKEESKLNRWNSICESAAKQSKRIIIPEVTKTMTLKEALNYAGEFDCSMIPYELAEGMAATKAVVSRIKSGMSVGIFIGPEGGFEEDEIELASSMGVEPVSLGKRILRTETAGLTALSVLMYHLECQM
ncbi:16S rRNA (uracil(1498)-N(3))-methyltransferase [Clostridium sp. chh4-2]|uniref:16S rRNA (uracil(1498)-N(3))-methyltransferase n=1 Tax=Clostridium sp. chh4-2 TaxID=2067550 RepID=UPI000CCDD568|nr:16S rRNA (uracil(1498)-N(3))-methyltransferase [Clostridium sp. chh4-2]PNV63718.1 16S rRNA (uracil(1498)-N(3))-methyltransferase [Clostridium sp. chh4-2]